MRKLWERVLNYSAATCAACLPGLAAAQTALDASASQWKFELTPYLFLPGVGARVQPGPLRSSSVSVSARNVLKAVDFAVMGTLEANRGDWGGVLDAMYIRLGVSNQFAAGLLGGYNLRLVEQIYTMTGYYRVVDAPSVALDLLGGARYANLDTTFSIDPSLLGMGRQIRDATGWWNGVVGMRVTVPLNDRWQLVGYLDAGEGSGSTSWQAIAGAKFAYSPRTTIKFGYRHFDFSRKDSSDGLLRSMSMSGVYAGLGFKF